MVCYVRCDNYTFNVNSYNRNYNSHVIIGGPQLKIYHVTGLKLSKKCSKKQKVALSVPIYNSYLRNFHKNSLGIQRGAILYDFWNFAVYLNRENPILQVFMGDFIGSEYISTISTKWNTSGCHFI